MDVVLAVVSFGMSSYLPKCLQPPQTKAIDAPPATLRLAATLSFLLLALSIIDSVPISWMIVLNERLVPTAYRIVLILLVTSVLVVFPGLAGARFVSENFGTSLDEWSKKATATMTTPTYNSMNHHHHRKSSWSSSSWIMWIFCKAGTIVSQIAVFLCQTIIINPIYRICGMAPRRCKTNSGSSILPITTTTTSVVGQPSPSPSPTSSGFSSSSFSIISPSLCHFRVLPLLGSAAAVGITISIVSTLSPWFVRTTSSMAHHSFHTAPFLSVTVAWLCSIGIFLSSLVNGFGSVSLPYSCLVGLYLEPISDDAINRAQQEFNTARQSYHDRQQELAQFRNNTMTMSIPTTTTTNVNKSNNSCAKLSIETPPSSGGGPLRKKLSQGWSFTTSTDDWQTSRVKKLTQESVFLSTLIHELEVEVSDMRQSQEIAALARTPWGRFRSWVGVVFSFILTVRLFAAAWFLWRHDHPSEGGSKGGAGGDPVTMTVLWLIGHNYVSQQQYNTLSQVISLLLTAYLSFSQVRTFVRAVDAASQRLQQFWKPCYSNDCDENNNHAHAQRQWPLHHRLTTGPFAPIISGLMCCYFLACVILTKLLVPAPFRRALAVALETTPSHFRPANTMATRGGGGGGGGSLAGAASDQEPEEEQLLRFFLRIRSYAVNSVFLTTALVSLLVLGMMLGLQRHQSMRHRSSAPVVMVESP